jgi:hypothetical protein
MKSFSSLSYLYRFAAVSVAVGASVSALAQTPQTPVATGAPATSTVTGDKEKIAADKAAIEKDKAALKADKARLRADEKKERQDAAKDRQQKK